MSLENLKKTELANMVRELKEKLSEMKSVEKQVNATAKELPKNAVSIIKDENGTYSIVKLKFDPESGAAAVDTIEAIGKDTQIAGYTLQKYTVEEIFRKV